MVKGVSRQVIVVQSPEKKLYEQAIFILREDAVGVTDEMLLKEAVQVAGERSKKIFGWLYACAGAAVVALIWLLTSLL